MSFPPAVADAPYVALTTFRRSGDPVTTPVWIAREQDALVVTTTTTTGKVKRLRHTPRVTLQPCSRSGEIAADAPLVEGVVELVTDDPGIARAGAALRRKYGAAYLAIMAVSSLARRRAGLRVILRITPA